jgi:transcriptional regulator with PAS, ATPase and Fis domain
MISGQNEQQALWDALDYFDRPIEETGLVQELERLEIDRITDALDANEGNRSRAARKLGIGRTLLIHKIKKYSL